MSREYAPRASLNVTEQRHIEQRRTGLTVAGVVFGIVVVITLALVGIHVVAQLDSMASNLVRVNTSLASLKTMNRKLDMLSGMSATLHQMNHKLSVTNAALATANERLSSMATDSKMAGTALAGMQRALGEMQGDIRVMSHKISRSFLFRSIK